MNESAKRMLQTKKNIYVFLYRMSKQPEKCLEGTGNERDPKDTAGALSKLLKSHTLDDENFLNGLMIYDFAYITCYAKGWMEGAKYLPNLEKSELSFFHLIARYDTGSVAARLGNPNKVSNAFVNKLHEVFVNHTLSERVNEFIEKINNTLVAHQYEGQPQLLLDFQVNGKTAEVWANEALASALRPKAKQEEKDCIPRFQQLIEIISWIKNPQSRFSGEEPVKSVKIEGRPRSDTETTAPMSVTSDDEDGPALHTPPPQFTEQEIEAMNLFIQYCKNLTQKNIDKLRKGETIFTSGLFFDITWSSQNDKITTKIYNNLDQNTNTAKRSAFIAEIVRLYNLKNPTIGFLRSALKGGVRKRKTQKKHRRLSKKNKRKVGESPRDKRKSSSRK